MVIIADFLPCDKQGLLSYWGDVINVIVFDK
jgi:hypothetical protein